MDGSKKIMLVAAHPDDEVIGAGIQMEAWRNGLTIVHVTDGSPANLEDARGAGFESKEAYAAARRKELEAAVALSGIKASQLRELRIPDQQASRRMPEIVEKLRELLDELHPDIVITHPYEGGHPDHDACAFAVAALPEPPEHWEFTSYHASPHGFETGEFVGPSAQFTRDLTPKETAKKQQIYAAYQTQQNVIGAFAIGPEKFRRAPHYDWAALPANGLVHYDAFHWGMHSEEWRREAAKALELLSS